MEDQALAVEEEDIPQPLANLFTPTEIEAFKMIELARIQNKYLTVGVLGTGVPRLACLRPVTWLKWWPSTAHLHQLKLKTLARGQASRGGRRKASSRGGLTSQACEEAERSRQGIPREVLMTQAMTNKTRQVPGGRQPV